MYAGNIIVVSSSDTAIERLLTHLRDDFTLKDLRPLHDFLGIEVDRSSDGSLLLHQSKYAKELLFKSGFQDCKSASTPLVVLEKLACHIGDPHDSDVATWYCSIFCGLQYLALTQPNIAFVVNQVCQYLHYPTIVYYTAIKCILRWNTWLWSEDCSFVFTCGECFFGFRLGWLF